LTIEEWARARRVSLVLHTFDRGGSGRVAGYLARGFTDLGMDVDMLVFARGGEVEEAVVELMGPDLPVRYFGRLSGWRPLDLLRGFRTLVHILRIQQPEIVIAAANNVALVTAFALRRAKLPHTKMYVKTTNPIASSRHRGLVRSLRLLGYRATFSRVSGVWTLSPQETAEMVKAFPEHAALFRDVANPYVTPAMLAVRRQAKPPRNGGKLVIAVARLTSQKRLERLIHAFAQVTYPDTRLLILGDGEERAELTSLVASLGLERRVSMPGHVPDVTPSLQAADLFVLTSDYEGLPAAVLEALSVNCPVLSTDCFPAARALLAETQGCGIITDVAPAALAAQIDEFLTHDRPTHLRAIAERYSVANGIRSHADAMAAADLA
jgi:glycosyltransferase involved in cell wall biosynthesis